MYAPLSLNVTVKFKGVIYYSHDQPPYQVRIFLGYEFSSYWSDKLCLWTDQPTIGPTNVCKAIYPHFCKGGHKKCMY